MKVKDFYEMVHMFLPTISAALPRVIHLHQLLLLVLLFVCCCFFANLRVIGPVELNPSIMIMPVDFWS